MFLVKMNKKKKVQKVIQIFLIKNLVIKVYIKIKDIPIVI